mgnify:CR=1 FL=1
MVDAIRPILSVGTFGTHILKNPAGTYSFVGTVPVDLVGGFPSFDAALGAFKAWFLALPAEEQRARAGDLREDVFAYVFGESPTPKPDSNSDPGKSYLAAID